MKKINEIKVGVGLDQRRREATNNECGSFDPTVAEREKDC